MNQPKRHRPEQEADDARDYLFGMPPHSREAEREVVAALLLGERESCSFAFARMEPGDFHIEQYRAMFAALKEAWKDKTVYSSPALLVEWLRTSEAVKRIERTYSGFNALKLEAWCEAARADALSAAIGTYQEALRRMRCERAIQNVLREATSDAFGRMDPAVWLKKTRNALREVERLVGEEPKRAKARQGAA